MDISAVSHRRLVPEYTPSIHDADWKLRVSTWQERKVTTPQLLPSPCPPSPSSSLVNVMVTDFNGLWKKAREATDETESIRTLAKILSSKDGRAFILDLEPQDAEFCIEILDHVNSNSPPAVPDGRSQIQLFRVWQRTRSTHPTNTRSSQR